MTKWSPIVLLVVRTAALAVCLGLAGPALAQDAPAFIPVQGSLTGDDGVPRTGMYTLEFRLYAEEAGPSPGATGKAGGVRRIRRGRILLPARSFVTPETSRSPAGVQPTGQGRSEKRCPTTTSAQRMDAGAPNRWSAGIAVRRVAS